jgi:hypothetical protein
MPVRIYVRDEWVKEMYLRNIISFRNAIKAPSFATRIIALEGLLNRVVTRPVAIRIRVFQMYLHLIKCTFEQYKTGSGVIFIDYAHNFSLSSVGEYGFIEIDKIDELADELELFDPVIGDTIIAARSENKSLQFNSNARGSGVAMPCGCYYIDEGQQLVTCLKHCKWLCVIKTNKPLSNGFSFAPAGYIYIYRDMEKEVNMLSPAEQMRIEKIERNLKRIATALSILADAATLSPDELRTVWHHINKLLIDFHV